MGTMYFNECREEGILPIRRLDDGDWLLVTGDWDRLIKANRRRAVAAQGMHLYTFGLQCARTGYARAVCMVGPDAASNAAAALVTMCARTGDPDRPMHGIPNDLYSDRGGTLRGGAVRSLLARLRIVLVEEPSWRRGIGGLGQIWQGEARRIDAFVLRRLDDGEILLSELNERLVEYERLTSAEPAHTAVNGQPTSRAAAWVACTAPGVGPLLEIPADILAEACLRKDVARIHQTLRALPADALIQEATA